MALEFGNRIAVGTSTTGTGTVTLGSAVSDAFMTFAEGGITDAATVHYLITEGDDFEIGTGTYTSSGTTLSRDTVIDSKISGTAGTSKMNLGGSAEVRVIAEASDFGNGVDWTGISALDYNTFVSGTDKLVVYDVSGAAAHYMTGNTLLAGIVADMSNGTYSTLSGYTIPMASGSNLRRTTLSVTQSATFEQVGTDTDIQTGEYLMLYGSGTTQKITFANFATALLNDIDTDDITEGATNLFYPAADASKLAGIESGADVTDATNVAAAGAVMTSDSPAYLDEEGQTLTGGAAVTSKSLGTQSSGTLTLDMGDRPLQHYTNNGAHTLAPGTVNGSCLVDITNGASAGAITTSGWTQVAGDDFTTTNAHKFRCHCSVGNAGSLLIVQAMQ